jgi:VWFA-related protein
MRTLQSLTLIVCLVVSVTFTRGQQPTTQQQADDVVRVSTELVQTEVMVFDQQGRFVDGLQREQFELKVDGKPQPVSFMERVVAGSATEAAQVSKATRGSDKTKVPPPVSRGRSVFFFVDDLHLSGPSVERTRKAILEFIDKEMGPDDQVLIVTPSNQIGFLQQLTNNKSVVRAAVERIKHRPYIVEDNEGVKMTEYAAIRILQGDRDAMGYYITKYQEQNESPAAVGGGLGPPSGGPGMAGARAAQNRAGQSTMSRQRYEMQVKMRAQILVKQSTNITQQTLSTLESQLRLSAQLPGRKLVFFISDGFYLVNQISGAGDRLRRITDAATRAGVVIYSLDARGLTGFTDASSNRGDPMGQLSRANAGELTQSQDPLNALAEDTGGRATFGTDGLNKAMTNALSETSNYYLLAWRPESPEQRSGNFRKVEVKVTGRPELTVRLPTGYYEGKPPAADAESSAKPEVKADPKTEKSVDNDMRNALTAFAPKHALPTQMALSYLDVPSTGPVLNISLQASTAALSYGADGKQMAAVDVAGVILNDQGKQAATFKTRLNVKPMTTDPSQPDDSSVIYNYKAPLTPGLYQVRVAARDAGSGRVGSAMQWVEVPNLSARRLTLSSLLIGGTVSTGAKDAAGAAGPQFQTSVDRRFKRASHLSFWVFVYNAARAGGGGTGAPDVAAQVQIFRDGKAIVTTPQRKLKTEGMTDMARIPYGGDFALSSLPPGRYILQVTITDRVSNASATERLSFDVE